MFFSRALRGVFCSARRPMRNPFGVRTVATSPLLFGSYSLSFPTLLKNPAEETFLFHKKAADFGDAVSQRTVGIFYMVGEGEGTEEDIEKGVHYLQLAADQGDARSLELLGFFYLEGLEELDQCQEKGIKYLEKAAELGSSHAFYLLGEMYRLKKAESQEEDSEFRKKTVFYYSKAGELNHPQSIYNLGVGYYYGKFGYEIDKKKGLEYLKPAAELGHPHATVQLGWISLEQHDTKRAREYFEKGLSLQKDDPSGLLGLSKLEQDPKKSLELVAKAADLGNAAAMCNLSDLYRDPPNGIEKNLKKALKYSKMAADQGFLPAYGQIAFLYDQGIGVENPEEVFKYIQMWADTGDLQGIYTLAVRFIHGQGVPIDDEKGRQLLKIAADGGLEIAKEYHLPHFPTKESIEFLEENHSNQPGSLLDVGWWYYFELERLNERTEQDREKGIKYLEKAAEKGSSFGFSYLGFIFPEKSNFYFEKAAELQQPESLMIMGLRYLRGTHGIEKDEQKGLKFLESAAELGDLEALSYLGYYYCGKDEKKALQYCQDSLKLDENNALASMGMMYFYRNGRAGLEKDQKKEFEFALKAAEERPAAMMILSDIYYDGNEFVQKNLKKAFEYMKSAADQEYKYAYQPLAEMYRHGWGVPMNKKLAFEYTKKAVDVGEMYAICDLGIMYYLGEGVVVDRAKAAECLELAEENGYEEDEEFSTLSSLLNPSQASESGDQP